MASRTRSSSTLHLALTALLASTAACSSGESETSSVSESLVAPQRPGGGRATPLPMTMNDDPLGAGDAPAERGRAVIRTAAQYRAAFGHAAPDSVRFGEGDVVIFYSAGTMPTGGFTASILSVVQIGRTLSIATHLATPGDDCVVTEAETTPYALVTVRPRGRTFNARFQHLRSAVDCEPASPCDNLDCPAGQHCELEEIVCVTTPCDPIPTCVDDDAPGPFCGGIASFPCPGSGECVDDPSDDCDPSMGGADCGGVCTCEVVGLCEDGYAWNTSPEVCSCAPIDENPCHLVDCRPGTTCEVQGGEPVCVPVDVGPNPCAFTLCPINTDCQVKDGEAVCVPIGGGGEKCGDTTCGAGLVCCNASCGICTPPDGACIQIACL